MAPENEEPKRVDKLATMGPGELPLDPNHPRAKEIAQGWQEATLATQSLSPGLALTRFELFDVKDETAPTDEMCSVRAGRWLAKSFGPPSLKVDGKSREAACRVYDFMGVAILSFSEPEIGTGWQFLLGVSEDHGGGRSYGRAGLLSCDPSVSDFWSPFCRSMAVQMAMDPLEAKALREARAIEAVAYPAISAPKARL